MEKKQIALIAHDKCKEEMVEWCREHYDLLSAHSLFATGTTGNKVSKETGLAVTALKSGPLGGDLQIGARIVDGAIDMLVFFWDPLTAQPHDPDVKALLRVATLKNIPVATNRASADYLMLALQSSRNGN
ncbi:MAG: methylglyoxal synthase [Firmicutes bacterium]|nr:methylglyoxal synthase [Bacillota bacterium]